MQRVLEKMAKKLNEYDEASLMDLWHRYAMQVQQFEPTKRWEEAALALSLIQAVHWKNQLFNYHLALTATPPSAADLAKIPPLPDFFERNKPKPAAPAQADEEEKPRAKVLSFPDKQADSGKKKRADKSSGKPDDTTTS